MYFYTLLYHIQNVQIRVDLDPVFFGWGQIWISTGLMDFVFIWIHRGSLGFCVSLLTC